MVCAIIPLTTRKGYASSKFVWREWNNQTGYSSDGFVFCAGMLNGAFAIGTPDGATHRKFQPPSKP
jgi:choline transport protein